VAIRGLEGGALPAGIAISPSADRSRLSVTVTDAAEPVDVTLQYQVADATNDVDRMMWGTVTLSVQDAPDPVTAVRVTEFGDRLLRLGWSPGLFNNSPITEYKVTVTDTGGVVLSTTSCTITVGCTVTTPGNGPDYAVRIAVVAVNAIGDSEPAQLPGAIWSDVIPPPPVGVTSTPLDHGLRVVWRKPATTAGTPIDSYVVTVAGQSVTVTVPAGDAAGTEYSRQITSSGIANGTAVAFSVSARNRAPNSLATWNEAGGSGTPAGPPLVVASPTASASTTDGTTASVGWADVFTPNGKAISTYYVVRHNGSAPNCTVSGVESGSPVVSPPNGPNVQTLPSSTTSATFTGLSPNTSYNFTVYAYNGQGCTASATVSATPRAAPGIVTDINYAGPLPSGQGTWDYRLNSVTITSGSNDVDGFQYRLSGGTTAGSEYSGTPGLGFLTADGTQYGNVVSVQVKACKQYPEARLCSADWSSPFELGRPVSVQLTGLQAIEVSAPELIPPTPGMGYWAWTGQPAVAAGGAPGYDTVTISCGGEAVPAGVQQCDVVGGGLTGNQYADLVVVVTANGQSYTRTYNWADTPH
jgi:hypothetical protein